METKKIEKVLQSKDLSEEIKKALKQKKHILEKDKIVKK